MYKGDLVTQETFDSLLEWLDVNRFEAAKKYEQTRRHLKQFFINRGCFEAEELTDETINRVTVKMPEIVGDYTGDPMLYFYACANKVHHEWLRRQKKIQDSDLDLQTDARQRAEYACLEICLETLSDKQRDLIITYYQGNKHKKTKQFRKNLAARLNIEMNILQVRAHRIRAALLKCVKSCLEKKM